MTGIDPAGVAPVVRTEPLRGVDPVGDARQQDFQRALTGLVGKSMLADVLTRLTDGSSLVKVAGTAVRMMLPANLPTGEPVPLTLVSLTPRPTFQLSSAPQSAVIAAFVDLPAHPGVPAGAELDLYAPGAALSRPAAAAGTGAIVRGSLAAEAAPAAPLPQADAAATRSTLSDTARVISSVLVAAARADHPQTAIVAPLPLLAAPPSTDQHKLAAVLNAVLKNAIGESGLFYESHVAEWSAGKRPLADLQREPQMQRVLAAVGTPEPAPAAGNAGAGAPTTVHATAAGADPATAQFINLQLTSQEQGRVAWQGQLWPGQDLAWQISRDPDQPRQRQDGGAEPPPPWRSALRLRFPLLGEIGATVVLAGDQLHIQLQAGSPQVGSTLRARAAELQRALEASGSTVASLTVADGVDASHAADALDD